MPTAKITGIASGLTLEAKDVDGNWRDLTDGDEIEDQEEVKVSSGGPRFLFDAYRVQKRVAGLWTDALTVEMDARSGSSHFRQDRFEIGGDDTDSTVELVLTVRKGSRQTAHDLKVLRVMQTDVGGKFSYPATNGDTFNGVFSATERTSDLEVGGFQPGEEAQIVTDREQWVEADLPEGPTVGEDLMWHDGSTPYRVLKVEADEISFVVTLGSVNK